MLSCFNRSYTINDEFFYYCCFPLHTSEYRLKCEEESNYLEAGRAHKQLGILRKQEEKRQQKAVRARQISERQDVQLAHNMQFSDFNGAWDSYMEGKTAFT